MSVIEKFSAIRKGLLEFLILRIIATDKVYVADMKRLGSTQFGTQEGTLYLLLSKMRRKGLDGAARSLNDNPDVAEIVADLEQAIADKCRAYLGPHKTVVSASATRAGRGWRNVRGEADAAPARKRPAQASEV